MEKGKSHRHPSFFYFLGILLVFSVSSSSWGHETNDDLLRGFLWEQLTSLPISKRPSVGLVLSGGGARGFAHVGTIEVLERAGFPVDVVAGTSIGAVVGSVYAGGASSEKMRLLAHHARLDQGTNFNSIGLIWLVLSDSLRSTKKMERLIQDQIGNKRFHELKKPFACVAMDLKTGERILFKEGWVAPAVRASMNLPGLFKPVEYRHRYLVDGGVVDYIPVDAAKKLGAQFVIASVTEGDYTQTEPTNVLLTLEQVVDIRGALLSRESRKQANFVIEHRVGTINFYDFSRSGEAEEQGEVATQAILNQAEESYLSSSAPQLLSVWKSGSP